MAPEVTPARTVGELLRALAELNPDLPVELEGCDCTGPLVGVQLMNVDEIDEHVYLRTED